MNILHLRYAVEISNTRSISKAAQNLYTSQPNLSRAIKELENELKIKIFTRSSKGIEVTVEGEEFLLYARNALAQIKKIENINGGGVKGKERLSISVPRASIFANAFSEFAKKMGNSSSLELVYKETNSMRTIINVISEEYDLGIVRYQSPFERYFTGFFEEKKLNYETLNEFSYVLLVSQSNPLAFKSVVLEEDLKDMTEISHGDPYVPTLPLIDVKRAELSQVTDKRIMIFERSIQFTLLEKVPNTFMWASNTPKELLDKYKLTEIKCDFNNKTYKDVLIYRKKYHLSKLDKQLIDIISNYKYF